MLMLTDSMIVESRVFPTTEYIGKVSIFSPYHARNYPKFNIRTEDSVL